ncbi:MAG: beta-ketoacyl-ACP synthase III [Fimbriimonas sp.]
MNPSQAPTRAVVGGVGVGLPRLCVTNEELAERVDTSDAWIRRRTGIGSRRVCGPGETTASLALAAAREALNEAALTGEDVDLVVCATVTSDYPSPSTASLVAQGLDADRATAFDLGAACAGFVYALSVVAALVETARARTALVVGVDTLTRYVDWNDRATCVLFGNGAGAVLLVGVEGTDRGVQNSALFGDGRGADLIRVAPATSEAASRIAMAGSEVFRFAVNAMVEACHRVLADAGLQTSDIDLFVPHQANLRIIEAAVARLQLDMAKVFVNVEHFGNTSGGSVPIALHEAVRRGRLRSGMRIMTVGFGAGLVWGANIVVW